MERVDLLTRVRDERHVNGAARVLAETTRFANCAPRSFSQSGGIASGSRTVL